VAERYFTRLSDQLKELVGRLTPRQKATVAAAGAVVFLGMLGLAFFTGRGSYVALARHKNVTELQTMAVQLRDAGYSVRVKEGTLEVRESELPRALSYVASEVTSTPRRDGWAWLDQDPSWGETSVRQQEKARRAKTINLEESIKICPDIVDAIVELNVKQMPFTILETGESGNSASVTVTLAPGVGRLKPGQVRVIRNIVSGGASVPAKGVKVTDNRLNSYPVDEGDGEESGGYDEQRQAQVADYRKRIAAYLEQTFRRCEYSLFVDVKLKRERVETDSETVTPPKKPLMTKEVTEREKGNRTLAGGVPGTKTNVSGKVYAPGESPAGTAGGDTTTIDIQDREHVERECATLVSRTHDRRSIPAGAIEQISVAIRLDKDALEKVVGKLGAVLKKSDSTDKGKGGGEVDDAVSAYLKTREDEIGKMLQLHGPVSVTVQPDILLATSGETETAVARSGGAVLWARENALLLVLLFVGFAAVGFIYILARRAIPPPIEIPPVEFADEEGIAVESGSLETPPADAVPTLKLQDEEFSGSVSSVEGVVREAPNVAAAVVKMWVGERAKPMARS
jgi:flagellar biosynthesis/type III secretory pathway M-ring protein FliF/YscJ